MSFNIDDDDLVEVIEKPTRRKKSYRSIAKREVCNISCLEECEQERQEESTFANDTNSRFLSIDLTKLSQEEETEAGEESKRAEAVFGRTDPNAARIDQLNKQIQVYKKQLEANQITGRNLANAIQVAQNTINSLRAGKTAPAASFIPDTGQKTLQQVQEERRVNQAIYQLQNLPAVPK